MKNGFIVALMTLVLVGCDAHQPTMPDWQAQCAGYGYQVGTMPYAQCVEREAQRAEENSRRGRIRRIAGEGTPTVHCKPDFLGGFRCQ
jgi:hypothetical protein